MNRAVRRQIERLPVSLGPWEARYLQHPMEMDNGVVVEGLLLLVDARTGLTRGAGPVTRSDQGALVVAHACLQPPEPGSPSRPRQVVCADGDTLGLIRSLGLGFPLQLGPTPEADRGLEDLRGVLRGAKAPPIPGVTQDLAAWKAVFTDLLRLAPWRRWPGREPIRLSGDPVLEAGALWIAEEEGSVLLSFCKGSAPPATAEDAWLLCLDPSADLQPSERTEVRKAGWILPGDRTPCVFQRRGPIASPLPAADERRFLGALQALVRLAEDPRRARATADTLLGPISASRTPEPPPGAFDLVSGDAMLVLVPGEPWELLIRQRQAEGLETSRRLESLRELRVARQGGVTTLHGWAADRALGVVARFDTPWELPREIRILVVQGGARGGPTWREKDLLFRRTLPLTAAPPPRSAPQAQAPAPAPAPHSTPLDPAFLGPSSTWPKASEHLARLMTDTFGPLTGTASDSEFRSMADLCALVFSAVSKADHWGDPSLLRKLDEATAPFGPFARMTRDLVERKRERFAGDPRMMTVDRVERRGGERVVYTLSAWPPHLGS